jgi:hypothetical protein
LECEFGADTEKIGGFTLETHELCFKETNLLLVVEVDAFKQESLHLGALEDDAHNKVVDVLILYQFATFECG